MRLKSFHIVGYTFNADIVCCDCVANWTEKELRQTGVTESEIQTALKDGLDFETGVRAYRSECLLWRLAKSDIYGIDYGNASSYDSDDFPKPVFADQASEDDHCGICAQDIL